MQKANEIKPYEVGLKVRVIPSNFVGRIVSYRGKNDGEHSYQVEIDNLRHCVHHTDLVPIN